MVKNLKTYQSYQRALGSSGYKSDNTKSSNIDDLVIKHLSAYTNMKKEKQRISISASIEVADNIANVDQKIENFLSYENVINNIKTIVNKGHIDLVETLSYKILTYIFLDSRAVKVWLKIEKLDVLKKLKA